MLTSKLSPLIYILLGSPSSAYLLPSFTSNTTPEPPSKVLPHHLAKRSANPINPQEHPDWAGAFDPNDCAVAFTLMHARLDFDLKEQFTFWSPLWGTQPAVKSWELPCGAVHDTCTLVFRMGKDFGDHVLPLSAWPGEYLQTTYWPGSILAHWDALLYFARHELNDAVVKFGMPAWRYGGMTDRDSRGAEKIVFLYAPTTSVIARRWANEGVGSQGRLVFNSSVLPNGSGMAVS